MLEIGMIVVGVVMGGIGLAQGFKNAEPTPASEPLTLDESWRPVLGAGAVLVGAILLAAGVDGILP